MMVLFAMLYAMLMGIPAMLCRVQVKKIGFSWTGLYTVREAGPKWANLCISLAGPLVNLLLAGALRSTLPAFAWVNLIACIYNLLPIPHSDGSRILALMSESDTLVKGTEIRPHVLGGKI
jgi:Zn-dependent protease